MSSRNSLLNNLNFGSQNPHIYWIRKITKLIWKTTSQSVRLRRIVNLFVNLQKIIRRPFSHIKNCVGGNFWNLFEGLIRDRKLQTMYNIWNFDSEKTSHGSIFSYYTIRVYYAKKGLQKGCSTITLLWSLGGP